VGPGVDETSEVGPMICRKLTLGPRNVDFGDRNADFWGKLTFGLQN